jgi:two-component system cell cycle sensor histidine kinase/response regulator CckA
VVLALATAAAGLGPLALPVSVAALVVAGGALAIVVRQRQREAAGRERFSVVLGTLDDAPVGHLVTNSGGAVVYANPAARALFGSARVERLDDVERLLGADEGQRATLRRLHDDAGDGAPDITELAHTDAGGDSWWRVSARPLDDLDGHVHWQFEDVTERRAHEASLRRQQATLIDFMNQAPVGFYSVDQDGRFLFANATLAAWLGVAPERLLDGTYRLQDFLVSFPAHVPPHGTAGDRAESVAFEAVMRDRNGRLFQASIAQTVVPGDDGRTTTRSLVRDLTPERQIREALRASEARFQRFFDDAPIGIALADHASCLTEWNSAFEQLVGEAGDDLAGRPIAQVLTERNPGIIDGRLSAVLAGEDIEGPLDVLVRGRRGDLSLLLFAKRLENGPGEPAGLILQFIDQTEQQKLEAQFTQSQKMQAVGQLAGGIAHDFNNLLTAMIGFCDLLLLRHKPGDPSFGDLMQVKQNANRAANLVRQLLAFSRQQTLQPRVLNVTDALADLSNLLRRLIGENIELKMVHGRDLGLVKVDQGQLEQVIINLAVNARDAMPNGGRLTITTANVTITAPIRRGSEEMPPGDYVSIEVADSGVGIPPEYLDRIFDPFFSTKEVGSGTGLGLSTVYGIVRQTGGYVFVESGPGRGASFAIHLPLHREPEAGRTGEAEAHDRSFRDLTGIGRILLVEDEDPVRVFSARALRNKGYDVLEARSGEEALEHIAADEAGIDLLITDVVMPKMDGPTLIRRVREIRPEMRVICISGYTEDRFRQHLDGEDTHFLAKPFSLKQLATKVKDVMREGVA